MSFESLGLSPALLRALSEQGYDTPTPIQTQAIPLVLSGHDLLGGAALRACEKPGKRSPRAMPGAEQGTCYVKTLSRACPARRTVQPA